MSLVFWGNGPCYYVHTGSRSPHQARIPNQHPLDHQVHYRQHKHLHVSSLRIVHLGRDNAGIWDTTPKRPASAPFNDQIQFVFWTNALRKVNKPSSMRIKSKLCDKYTEINLTSLHVSLSKTLTQSFSLQTFPVRSAQQLIDAGPPFKRSDWPVYLKFRRESDK